LEYSFYWTLQSSCQNHSKKTRGSHEPVSFTQLFICKFMFNVQWSLDFKKKYYVHF
jgi:hypothetical protein